MLSIYGMYSIFNLEKANVCACVIYIYILKRTKILVHFHARISVFSDFEATHAKQGYRYRGGVVHFGYEGLHTPQQGQGRKTNYNNVVDRSNTVIICIINHVYRRIFTHMTSVDDEYKLHIYEYIIL